MMETLRHFRAVKLRGLVLMVDSSAGVKLLVLSRMGPASETRPLPGGTLGSAAVLLPESLAKIFGVFW